MQLSNVTNEDGKRCANLINFLKAGRWDLSGNDAEELVRVKKWVQELAITMAQQLKKTPTPPETGFKVRNIGTTKTPRRKK